MGVSPNVRISLSLRHMSLALSEAYIKKMWEWCFPTLMGVLFSARSGGGECGSARSSRKNNVGGTVSARIKIVELLFSARSAENAPAKKNVNLRRERNVGVLSSARSAENGKEMWGSCFPRGARRQNVGVRFRDKMWGSGFPAENAPAGKKCGGPVFRAEKNTHVPFGALVPILHVGI